MGYTRKGFTGNDGDTPYDPVNGWDSVEVQERWDIEDTLVGDSIQGAKDSAGHKHATIYKDINTPAVSCASGQVITGLPMSIGQAAILGNIIINTADSGSDSISALVCNGYSWRPACPNGILTVTITNAVQGMLFFVTAYSSCGYDLHIGGCSIAIKSGGIQTVAILLYDHSAWRIMSEIQS